MTPPLQSYIRPMVKSGRYESASEVVRDSLRAMQDRERATAEFWTGVNNKVAIARRQVAGGETVDGDAAMDQILAELESAPSARRRSKKTSQ